MLDTKERRRRLKELIEDGIRLHFDNELILNYKDQLKKLKKK